MGSLAEPRTVHRAAIDKCVAPTISRAGFLQPLQRLNAHAVRGIELGQIELKRLVRIAYAKQVGDLHICEASGHTHDVVPGMIGDVDPALHVVASQSATVGPSSSPCRMAATAVRHKM